MNSELTLVSIAGRDRGGLTSALTGIMARYGVRVLDFGQAVIHDNLAWGMLIEVPAAQVASPLYRDLAFKAHELDLNIRFSSVSEPQYDAWVAGKVQPRHIITLLGRQITAEHIARVSRSVTEHQLNIERIERLSGRVDRRADPAVRRAAIPCRAA